MVHRSALSLVEKVYARITAVTGIAAAFNIPLLRAAITGEVESWEPQNLTSFECRIA